MKRRIIMRVFLCWCEKNNRILQRCIRLITIGLLTQIACTHTHRHTHTHWHAHTKHLLHFYGIFRVLLPRGRSAARFAQNFTIKTQQHNFFLPLFRKNYEKHIPSLSLFLYILHFCRHWNALWKTQTLAPFRQNVSSKNWSKK